MKQKTWTREETIVAFCLYCQTPFGRISKSNPEIIELAELLDRTPGSLALKMCNFAAVDPNLKQSGMGHGANLVQEIFDEFSHNFIGLAYQADQIINRLKSEASGTEEIHQKHPADPRRSSALNMDLDIPYPLGKEKETIIRQRVGQKFFRRVVLASYNSCCCVTGLNNEHFLIASHIKPWKVATEEEKTNPANGLCLNPFHDTLFDQGYMTLDHEFKILLSPQIRRCKADQNTLNWIEQYRGKTINLPRNPIFRPDPELLEFHRNEVFLT